MFNQKQFFILFVSLAVLALLSFIFALGYDSVGTNYTNPADYFLGDIKQFRIYKRALSGTEISANFANTCNYEPMNASMMVFYAPLNEGTTAVAPKDVLNNLSGTHSGTGNIMSRTGLSTSSCITTACEHCISTEYLELAGAYRYGFNGQEKDDEIKGSGNSVSFDFRILDTRLGRFLSVDPLSKEYPWNSTYAFAENDVIRSMDLEGREKSIVIYDFSSGKMQKTKIELETAGKLGNGVAVQLIRNGVTTNFYGTDVKDAEQFTRSYEGLSLDRYNDQYGNPTIGYGHLITKSEEKTYPEGSPITKDQANTLFTTDYTTHKSAIMENLEGFDLTQNQQDALVDFGYNTGASKVKKFTTEKGEGFFLGYMKGGAGIQKRRIGEALLFSEGKYLHFDKIGNKKNNTYLNQLIKDNTKTETPAATPTPANTCDDECTN